MVGVKILAVLEDKNGMDQHVYVKKIIIGMDLYVYCVLMDRNGTPYRSNAYVYQILDGMANFVKNTYNVQ